MRRLVVFTVLAIGLAVPATALGVGDGGSNDGTVSVKNGRGRVTLAPFNGSAVGRVGLGKVFIIDPVFSDGDGVDIWGCNVRHDTDTTTFCRGDNIRFRAVGGKYTIVVRGRGIFLSAVGRGTLIIDGSGDDPDIETDGLFSINGAPYRSLPDVEKTFPIDAPAGG
jgi:hypothetical protein